MSRGRRVALAVAFGALAAVIAVGAAVGWAVLGGGRAYGHALERYGDGGEANRFVDLPDGQAQLAIGSPDGHRIVVQWRDPDGHGWTEPETVWTDEENTAIENTIRYGGGTVAVRQVFTTNVHSDSDIDSLTVGIVCRDLRCTASEAPGYGGEAQVTPDGRWAYLGQDEDGALLWTADEGIRRVGWSGHPGFADERTSSSEPVLAPDGSLRVVSSRRSGRACSYDLLAGEPGTADLTRVARTSQTAGRSDSDCRTHLHTYSTDWLTVNSSAPRTRTFWFVREGGTWSTSRRDASGLRVIDVDRGCCDSYLVGFVHWNDVAFGSPDGRRVQVQTHLLGDETWSRPTALPGATAGHTCTWMDGYEIGPEGFAVVMTCSSGQVRDEFSGDAFVVAATPDLRRWESRFVTDVRRPPAVDDDRVRVGGLTWTPEDGFSG